MALIRGPAGLGSDKFVKLLSLPDDVTCQESLWVTVKNNMKVVEAIFRINEDPEKLNTYLVVQNFYDCIQKGTKL